MGGAKNGHVAGEYCASKSASSTKARTVKVDAVGLTLGIYQCVAAVEIPLVYAGVVQAREQARELGE